MKRSLVCMMMLVVTAATVASAVGVDPDDAVLVAYELSGIEPGDGQISSVWDSWDGKDYVLMTPENHGWQRGTVPWSGVDDASFTVKAAYDDNGLYVYCEVADNSFVEAQDGYQFDKVDLYVDNQSSTTIYSKDPFEVFCYPTWWQLTYTSIQFQVAFGGASAPTTFACNYYDETMWEMTYNTISMDEAETNMDGLSIDIADLGGSKKAQEWYLPWSQVGIGGTGGKPGPGTRLAFAGGYNDLDADNPEAEQVNCLRWIAQRDPFNNPDEPEAWGDIQLGEGDPAVSRIRTTRVRSVPTRSTGVRVFTLSGRGIAVSGPNAGTRGVVITRHEGMNATSLRLSGLSR